MEPAHRGKRGAQDAAALLGSVLYAGTEERASIASTAGRALKGYRLPGAIESTNEPNFDPEAFVRGGPGGRADTVYIMSTSRQQEAVTPLVVALLGRIREAAYKVHREHGERPSTVFALDELYGLAPLPDLPAMLTDDGSQGLLVVGAVQDLTLIKSRWPNEAAGFLTLFGNILVFPGIRDTATLDAVSKLIGDHDAEKEKESTTYGGPHTTTTHSTHREAIYAPSQISAGIEPGNPDVLLFLHQWGWDKLRATPWWRFDPWPQVLAAYLIRALSGRVPEWRMFEYLNTRGDQPDVPDVLTRLPMPDLGRWVTEWHQDRSCAWRGYWAQRLQAEIIPALEQRRDSPLRAATWELDPSWMTPGAPWSELVRSRFLLHAPHRARPVRPNRGNRTNGGVAPCLPTGRGSGGQADDPVPTLPPAARLTGDDATSHYAHSDPRSAPCHSSLLRSATVPDFCPAPAATSARPRSGRRRPERSCPDPRSRAGGCARTEVATGALRSGRCQAPEGWTGERSWSRALSSCRL